MNRGTETGMPSNGIPPRVGPRKRKEAESSFLNSPKSKLLIPAQAGKEKEKAQAQEPAANSRLLACYMAYEFLTRGTLLGQKYEGAESEPKRVVKPESEAESKLKELQSYEEVSTVLKTGGAHIPGLVNPTQLARWIRR